jgi:hypothetical protein
MDERGRDEKELERKRPTVIEDNVDIVENHQESR